MEEQHISTAFDEDLDALNSLVSKMGGMVVSQLRGVMDALAHNHDILDNLIENDAEIDRLEDDINAKVVEIIAVRSPIAKDLRIVLSAVKIAQMLERIGDYAGNIAARGKYIIGSKQSDIVMEELQKIGHLAHEMMVDVVDALKHSDPDKARKVWKGDVELDRLYNTINRQFIKQMDAGALSGEMGSHCFLALKHIERIGDHATGIAEQIYFRIHGEGIDGNRPKENTTYP